MHHHNQNTLLANFLFTLITITSAPCALADAWADDGGAPVAGPTVTLGAAPPATVSEITDGTLRDVAASERFLFLAEGRRLAVFHLPTGQRLETFEPVFDAAVRCVEFDPEAYVLAVGTSNAVYVYDLMTRLAPRVWTAPEGGITDLKLLPDRGALVVATAKQLYVLDQAGPQLTVLGEVAAPAEFVKLRRVGVWNRADGSSMAFVTGLAEAYSNRGTNLLAIVDLDEAGAFAAPAFSAIWDPVQEYGSYKATANFAVHQHKDGRDYAYVAAGQEGQVTQLDVTDPTSPWRAGQILCDPEREVANIQKDAAGQRIWAATPNVVHTISLAVDRVVGKRNVGSGDGGERDMAYVSDSGGSELLWTAVHAPVDYALMAIDVTENIPERLYQRWWISSNDGLAAVPDWDSVYLPTFGGVVRYDVREEADPRVDDTSFQPSTGITEHIDVLQIDDDLAYVVTALGSGGFEAYEVTRQEPNPKPPLVNVELPWMDDVGGRGKAKPNKVAYTNEVAAWSTQGAHYVLVEVTNRTADPHEHYLQAYLYNPTSPTRFDYVTQVKAGTSSGKGIGHSLSVCSDYAFVGLEGFFFVVDLSGLPVKGQLVVTDEVAILGQDGVRGITCDENHVFVSMDGNTDGSALRSYEIDFATGDVGGLNDEFVDALTVKEVPELALQGRIRYEPTTRRIYAGGTKGRLYEVDASDPKSLSLRSVWSGVYDGETQDCRIYDFGAGPRVLFVKNNEAFAILDPDD